MRLSVTYKLGRECLPNLKRHYLYDELKCTERDNPTIGLLLCSETSKDWARYSILKDSKQIYAAKYLTYLPTREQLAAEINKQKEIFALQAGKNRN
ncbi:MAG: DUF1016 domain-containing protein [Muribaculaceae bacterium]|nr:DUF1016 domain-containing protein [Muribaculaceae bacterium]